MKVFISWSRDQSKQVAIALRDWLRLVLQYVDPWLSEIDISAGDRWSIEVGKNLEDSKFGILCLTRENLNAPWIFFEAGALAKSISAGAVCPYLLDVDFKDISGPLAQFQAKKADEESTFQLITSINQKAESPIGDSFLAQLFSALWPKLSNELSRIRESSPNVHPRREPAEVLEDVIASIRGLDQKIDFMERTDRENRALIPEMNDYLKKFELTISDLLVSRQREERANREFIPELTRYLGKMEKTLDELAVRHAAIHESYENHIKQTIAMLHEFESGQKSEYKGTEATSEVISSLRKIEHAARTISTRHDNHYKLSQSKLEKIAASVDSIELQIHKDGKTPGVVRQKDRSPRVPLVAPIFLLLILFTFAVFLWNKYDNLRQENHRLRAQAAQVTRVHGPEETTESVSAEAEDAQDSENDIEQMDNLEDEYQVIDVDPVQTARYMEDSGLFSYLIETHSVTPVVIAKIFLRENRSEMVALANHEENNVNPSYLIKRMVTMLQRKYGINADGSVGPQTSFLMMVLAIKVEPSIELNIPNKFRGYSYKYLSRRICSSGENISYEVEKILSLYGETVPKECV